jgi:heat-inducible transcriptional repressor
MPPLDARKVRILEAIVHDYVTTTKPVGSERLIEVYKLGCKSATVRNEMAEMAEMGYLVQPHTSAGRIPTDRGYRFYVDELMNPPGALQAKEAATAKKRSRQAHTEIEEIVQQTCKILSEITSYTSIATDPSSSSTSLRRIYLSAASPRHLLLVVLLSTGHVEHRLVETDGVPGENTLQLLANYVNSQVGNKDLEDIGRMSGTGDIPAELHAFGAILSKVWPILKQAALAFTEGRVYLEGTNQLLRQPEFHDIQRLENLLSALQQRTTLYQVLSRSLQTTVTTTILIGAENDLPAMQTCSIISTSYRIGQRAAGYLGVVGPTRMNYDRAVAAVGLMAHNLSQMLTHLSLSE